MDVPVVVEPKGQHKYTIIWCHGLGADGHDFAPLVPDFAFEQTKFVFPHAPVRPITLNGGMPMRGWYDIESLDVAHRQDKDGVQQAASLIQGMMAEEMGRGIPAEHILLVGFSQGGAVILYAGATFPQKIAGMMALSTYLPIRDHFEVANRSANLNTPIMMCHGEHDDIIDLNIAEMSCDALKAMGYNVDWRTYPMPHSVCAEQLSDMRAWIRDRWSDA